MKTIRTLLRDTSMRAVGWPVMMDFEPLREGLVFTSSLMWTVLKTFYSVKNRMQ